MGNKLYNQSNIDLCWVCQSERFLYAGVIIWVNTILNNSNTMVVLPRYEESC